MTVSTTSAAVHITPTVLKTFLKHYKHKTHNLKEGVHGHQVATDDILFDEAFNIVKAFIKLGTENTIESLQAFTNTHVPSPWWAAVVPVMVPLSTCNKAADTLIDWFGPDDLHKVVGGERWWQVRGLDGIEAEWITENEFLDTNTLKKEGKQKSKELSAQEETIQKMEKLETVMLYIHGGAYFWGSINTHRYQIIRYARKCKGRAFTVNYRKAPQYPWPCPLHDVLAAYFYLISPPPGAAHKPVPASKLVFAGDSAGGALCVTALTVIRDMGLPMPAGAVLISPWVDMTHSFPSVMDNTHSDIIPPHGFVHKPSTTWPVHTLPDKYGRTRVMPTQTNPPPPPGHADKLDPDPERLEERAEVKEEAHREGRDIEEVQAEKEAQDGKLEEVMSQEEMVGKAKMDESPSASPEIGANANLGVSANGVAEKGRSSSSAEDKQAEQDHEEEADNEEIDKWEPKPPKVLMDDPSERPWEIRSQIQQYATNEQLSHPLVSPILQGSLGNLCPLYILAGDGEVLRDEIIYFAHRAAHPDEYPVRKGVIREGRRQRENAKKFTTPTKVHLQAFDGMPHVLTVFIFTPSAKYAYRSIAQFVKHVTTHSADHIARNPFPELHRPPDEDLSDDEVYSRRKHKVAGVTVNAGQRKEKELEEAEREEVNLYKRNQKILAQEVREDDVDPMPGKEVMKGAGEDQNGNGDVKVGEGDEKKKDEAQYDREPQENDVESMHGNGHAIPGSDEDDTTYARPTMDETKDIPHILMIRERVDIHGHVRPMEPKSDIPALQMRPSRIGIIKERPVRRWADGQNAVDKKYRHSAEKVIKKRKKLEAKAERMLADAREQGLLLENDSIHRQEAAEAAKRKGVKRADSDGDSVLSTISRRIDVDRRWGPLDLQNERPPPTAIAARRDTPEALALLKKSIYHTAPKTHMTIPKAKMMQNFRAAFDPNDDPFRAPRQSVSEQQKKTYIVPIHGLTLWNSVLQLFVRKSAKKALKGKMHASKIVDKVVGGEDEPVSKRSGSDAKLQTEEKRSGPSQY